MRYVFVLFLVLVSFPAFAQEVHEDFQSAFRAKVLEIVSDSIDGQVLRVEILEGQKTGEILELRNDYVLLKVGDKFFLNFLRTVNGDEFYTVGDKDRRFVLLLFVGIFALSVVILGRWQGIKALAALFLGFFIIFYFMLPRFLAGGSPVLTGVIFSALILAFAMAITHGINRKTISAFLGATCAIIFSAICGYFGVILARLSGFSSDEAIYLNLGTNGSLDISGLLLAGIIIGVIGILDDIAITQASIVEELWDSVEEKKEIFKKAMRIGREHVGALVNTLALAYTGASLPLLLLFSISESNWSLLVNREIFASEIIRTIVGSIGLVAAVPITTALAIFFISRKAKGGL